jgi:hypothetical protein
MGGMKTWQARFLFIVLPLVVLAVAVLLWPSSGSTLALDKEKPAPSPTPTPSTLVYLSPQSQTVGPWALVAVDVLVDDVSNLGAYRVTLSFDPALLTSVSVANGPFLESTDRDVSCLEPTLDEKSVVLACLSKGPKPPGPSGSGHLATITLASTCESGTSALELSTTLLEPLSNHIPNRAEDGTVTITEEILCSEPPDSDLDGCADLQEIGMTPENGGMRDPNDPWDFFDTPNSANKRDAAITIADVFAVAGRFGAAGEAGGDPQAASVPAAPAYHAAFDRGDQTGANTWNRAPADGTITIEDIFAVAGQFGHDCS